MHAMFYLSAIPAGLALTVMAIYLCMRSLNVRVDFSILSDCGRMIQLLLIVFAFFRLLDLVANQALHYAFQRTAEAGYFWLEMVLFLAIPIFLLSLEQVRSNPEKLYWACAVVVAGFMANRLNVSINSLQAATGRTLRAEVDGTGIQRAGDRRGCAWLSATRSSTRTSFPRQRYSPLATGCRTEDCRRKREEAHDCRAVRKRAPAQKRGPLVW